MKNFFQLKKITSKTTYPTIKNRAYNIKKPAPCHPVSNIHNNV